MHGETLKFNLVMFIRLEKKFGNPR